MKIRQGFVSNSSSSSYIIHIKDAKEPCPTCGRTDPNIIDLINSQRSGWESEETCVQAEDKATILNEIKHEISHLKRQIEDVSRRDPNEPVYPLWHKQDGKPYTHGDQLKYYKTELQENEEYLEKAQQYPEPLAKIQISYHDRAINEIFENLRASGAIEVIEDHS